MASPAVHQTYIALNPGTAGTSHSASLSAPLLPGCLMLVFGRVAAGAAAVTLPAGWTVFYDVSDSSDDTTFWAYRDTLSSFADEGTSLVVTHASAKCGFGVVLISGAADPATQPPQASAYAIGSSTSPNSPAVTPTGGSKDYLFLTVAACQGSTAQTGDPAGYTWFIRPSAGGGSTATQAIVIVASKAATAASDDPGAWTIPTTIWTAFTVAVHPPGPAGTPHTVTPSDSVMLTDARTAARGKRVTDPLALADVFSRATATQRTVADTFTLTDARAHARGITVGGGAGAFVASDFQAGTPVRAAGASPYDITAPLPADVIAGDLLLFLTEVTSATAIGVEPAGWTLLFNEEVASDGFRIYGKIAGSSESAPVLDYTVNPSVSVCVVLRVRGVGGMPAQFSSQMSGTATPSIDPPATGSVKFAVAHIDPAGSLPAKTWLGGATKLVESINGVQVGVSVAYKVEDTAGALSSTESWALFNSSHVIFSIAPVAAAGDGVALVDLISPILGVAGFDHVQPLADTLTLADTFARVMAYGRTQADGLILVDSTRDAQGIRLGDVVLLVDQLTRIATRVRTFADTLALTDSTARTTGKSKALTDAIALTDQLARAVAKARTLADTVALTDQLTRATTKTRTVSDAVLLADARRIAQGQALADAVALSDQLTRIAPRIRTFTDTVLLSDAVLTSKTGTGQLNPADLVQIADSFSRIVPYKRSVADPVLLTDARQVGRGKRVTDQITLTDLLARTTGKTRTIADLIALTDFVVTSKVTGGYVLNYATDIRWGEVQADRVLVGVDEVWTP